MCGDRKNNDSPVEIPSHGCKTDFGYDRVEGKRRGMAVGLGGRGAGGNRDLANMGVC